MWVKRDPLMGWLGAAVVVPWAVLVFLVAGFAIALAAFQVPGGGELNWPTAIIGGLIALAGLALCAAASRTLFRRGAVGKVWAAVLPTLSCVLWAGAIVTLLNPAVIGMLPPEMRLLAATGFTIPIGIVMVIVYAVVRFARSGRPEVSDADGGGHPATPGTETTPLR